MTFGVVPETVWQLCDRIGARRKSRLLETSFEEIVARIALEYILGDLRLEPHSSIVGVRRVSIQICLQGHEVPDIFHNGAGGYRAQYYFGISEGERANRYVLAKIREGLEERRATHPDLRRDWRIIDTSLSNPWAKMWTHEGAWLSDNNPNNRNLLVARWRQNACKITLKHKFEPSWAQLTPKSETKLEIKGGWLDDNLGSAALANKRDRSQEIHDFGYT